MNRLVLFLCFVLMAFEATAANTYRNFTDTQGRTIRGCVVAYNATKKVVTFQRDDRKTSRVPLAAFSEEDQAYILEWEATDCFLKSSSFKIDIDREKDENKEKSGQTGAHDIHAEDTHYAITFENRADVAMKDITVEYCIYYEQVEGKERNEGVCYGDIKVDIIGSRSKKTCRTKVVTTYKSELDGGYYYASGANSSQKGSVRGIKLRVHMKTQSGKKVTRESSLPTGMNDAWKTKSINVGMN